MSVLRVMGLETEYGVSRVGGKYENHAQLSFDVIEAVRALSPSTAHVAWNYGHEDPVHDARGYHMPRAHVSSDLLTDREELRATNAPHINGARIYVDHCHPEYSSPETISPREAVLYNHAGDAIMQHAMVKAQQPITLYRNNVDGKGASWGSHENYQVERAVPFDMLSALFTAHAVSRQIYTGAGRVGLGEESETPGFQISQRADYFAMKEGLQTTFHRPIVNTRDESHSTDTYRRFHVIVGDANRMDVPDLLKLGVTSLLFWALEHSYDTDETRDFVRSMSMEDPVEAMHSISHDLSLAAPIAMSNGDKLSAIDIQLRLRSWVYAVAAAQYDTDSRGEPRWPDEDTHEIVQLWQKVLLDCLEVAHADDTQRLQLSEAASRLEWLLKWQVCESMRRRKNIQWSSPLLQAMDISWARIDAQSLFAKVAQKTERLFDTSLLEHATHTPPASTRAYTRGLLLQQYAAHVLSVSWDIVVLDIEGRRSIIDMAHPLTYTRADSADTFTADFSIEEVEKRLTALTK